jgi:hypothetical protein
MDVDALVKRLDRIHEFLKDSHDPLGIAEACGLGALALKSWHAEAEMLEQQNDALSAERDALRTLLHSWRAHPDYEYTTTTGPRKAWWGSDDPPDGDGWVSNNAAGRNGWERFDYHEERYWMRRKPVTALAPAEQPKEGTP